jgi:hypothetical protein
MTEPATYRDLAERSWAWVQSQVGWNEDGPWLPAGPGQTEPDDHSYEMHSGVGGLAHLLAEIRLTATSTRCSRPVRAGCRAPPGSRRTSSVWLGPWISVAVPRQCRGWTPGGPCRDLQASWVTWASGPGNDIPS